MTYKMTNYTEHAVKGAATILIISILAAFLGYLVRFLLARNLTVEQFGLFYSVFSFLGLFLFIKSLGLDRSLIKFIPEFKHQNKPSIIKSLIVMVTIIQLITNSIVIVGIYFLSDYLSLHFFHSAQAGLILKLMAVAFFIDNFVFILKFSFQGFQKMVLFASVDLARMLLILAIIFVGFKFKYGILSAVIAYIAAPVVLLVVYSLIFVKKVFPKFDSSKMVFDSKIIKKMTKFGMYVIAVDFGWLLLGYTDSMALTYFVGLTSVGLYNIVLPTASVLTYFPKAVANVVLPLSSELWVKKKDTILKAGMELLYKYTIIVTLPLALMMFSFTDILINVLFGSRYLPAANSLKILSVGMIFSSLYFINANFLAGIGRPEINSKIVYGAALFNLIFNIILIPLMGIVGAAIITTISYFIMMIIGLIEIKKYVEISLPIKIWIKCIFSGIIFVMMIELLKSALNLNLWLETFVIVSTTGMVYLLMLFLMKVIDISELSNLYKRITR